MASNRIMGFLSLLLIATMMMPSYASPVKTQSTTPPLTFSIVTAYYADTDSDGLEDDVYSEVFVQLNGKTRMTFDYYITLTLPSGLSFTYAYRISTKYDSFTIANDFFDHASEPGWYDIYVQILLRTGGTLYQEGIYTFDPPGGTCCSDPTFSLSLK